MRNDRFLTGILAAVALLIVLAVSLFLVRRNTEAYISEDTPEGVVHNYVLALQKGNYERAYDYLAEGENKPERAQFQRDMVVNEASMGGAGLQLGQVEQYEDEAVVEVVVIQTGGGPFSTPWRNLNTVLLVRSGDAWKIKEMPYPYWGWNWYQSSDGRILPPASWPGQGRKAG